MAQPPSVSFRRSPAFDYDDGRYPTSAIGSDSTVNPGSKNSGALNGGCHDESNLAEAMPEGIPFDPAG